MRVLLVLLISSVCALGTTEIYGQGTVHKFIDQVKKKDESIVMTIPGWIIRKGLSVAYDEDMLDEKGYKDIVRGIKQIRFAVIDDDNDIPNDQVRKLVRLSKERDGLEEYINYREDGEDITVMVKEKDNKVSNITIVTNSNDEFAIVNIKTNISLNDLQNADFKFNQRRESN